MKLRDQQGQLIQLNDSNYDLSFLLEIYEKDIIQTENRRALAPENALPLPITLGTPDIPEIFEDQPNLDEIVGETQNIQPDLQTPLQTPLPPPIQPPLPPPIQQRSEPIAIPTTPDYSSHDLADVLLKA